MRLGKEFGVQVLSLLLPVLNSSYLLHGCVVHILEHLSPINQIC